MRFSSSTVQLLVLTASAVIQGSNAFVTPNPRSALTRAIVPSFGSHASLIKDAIEDEKEVEKFEKILKDLDDIDHIDPEEEEDLAEKNPGDVH